MLIQELNKSEATTKIYDDVGTNLLQNYRSDDTRKVKESSADLRASWMSLNQSTALEAELRMGQTSFQDLENLLKWTPEAETIVNVLADVAQRENAHQDAGGQGIKKADLENFFNHIYEAFSLAWQGYTG